MPDPRDENVDKHISKPKQTPRPPKPDNTHPKEPGDVRKK